MSFVPEFVKCAFFTQFQMKMKINMTKIIPPFLVSIVLQFTGLPKKDENSESN